MHVALLMTINDYPARASLSGWSGQGYLACSSCNDVMPSKRLMSKNCFVGHRQWLPIGHRMRNNRKFDGKVDHCAPPPRKSVEEILFQLQNIRSRVPGKHEKFSSKE